MIKIVKYKCILAFCLFLIMMGGFLEISFAQPGNPGDNTDPDVPISGIEWLLIAGGIFGARKIYNRIKKG